MEIEAEDKDDVDNTMMNREWIEEMVTKDLRDRTIEFLFPFNRQL